MSSCLDHLVVAAQTLEQGRTWIENLLGVPMQEGGQHPMFGTHNALLSLGPQAYLEVIAIDPHASSPACPRWFALDTQAMHERLEHSPALIHWVARLDQESQVKMPHPLELSRGKYRWCLSVPDDGHLPLEGAAPSLIQWHTSPPTCELRDNGLRLQQLQITTPKAAQLNHFLNQIQCTESINVTHKPRIALEAVIDTLNGPITLK